MLFMAVLSLAVMRFVAEQLGNNDMRVQALETANGCGERNKALKGEPQERIWSEIWPAGVAAVKRQEVEKT